MSDPRYKTEYGLGRLIRYHGKRQQFFDDLHRIVLFINAILGSSAFVAIISQRVLISAWLTAIVAIASALDNVVAFSERARKHSEQRQRYYDLYCEVVATKPEEFDFDYFREKRLRIDRDSPPLRKVLDVVSRNDEDTFRGHAHDELIFVGKAKFLLRHLIDLPPQKWITNAERKRPAVK